MAGPHMLLEVQTESDLREENYPRTPPKSFPNTKIEIFHLSQRDFEVMSSLMILSRAACQVLVLNYAFNLGNLN